MSETENFTLSYVNIPCHTGTMDSCKEWYGNRLDEIAQNPKIHDITNPEFWEVKPVNIEFNTKYNVLK